MSKRLRVLPALRMLALCTTATVAVGCSSVPDEAQGTSNAALSDSLAAQRPGLLGINASESATDIADVKTLTARRVRLEFKIKNGDSAEPLEHQAYWDKQRDDTIAAYRTTLATYAKIPGLRVMMTVDYMSVPHYKDYLPTLANGQLPTAAETARFMLYVAQYTRHLAAIVDGLKDHVTVWEIWNEPDSRGAGPLTSKLFPLLLRDGTKTARAHAPSSAKIITGIATVQYWQHIIQDEPKVITEDVVNLVDAVNLHPYNNWPALTQPAQYAADYPTANGQSLAAVLVAIDRLIPKTKPIYFSEFGDQTKRTDEKQEADYLAAFYSFMASPPASVAPIAARVHEAYFFCIRDFRANGVLVPMGLVSGTNPIGAPNGAHAKTAWTTFLAEAHTSPP